MHSGAIHVVHIRGDGREADAAPLLEQSVVASGGRFSAPLSRCLSCVVCFLSGHSLCFKQRWRVDCMVSHARTGGMWTTREGMAWHGLVLEPEPSE